MNFVCSLLVQAALLAATASAQSDALEWQNVRFGGGGGFVSGIIFHPNAEGVAYARTDIGGLYKLDATDDSWIPVTDELAHHEGWHNFGIDAVALDPQDASLVYIAAGLYTTIDDTNGCIIRSTDQGATWSATPLPFKIGGNMPGRGVGERLAVDPANSQILFFGARSGNGLWRSHDAGGSFERVESFTAVGNFAQNASDESGYLSDLQGLTFVTFDPTSGVNQDGATNRIFVGSASKGPVAPIWVSEDAGATWMELAGQPRQNFFAHKAKIQPVEKALYITYSDGTGPFDGANGTVSRYDLDSSTWSDITPNPGAAHGYGGLGLDMLKPGTLVVAALNLWWPDVQLFRSTDSGKTWSTIWEWTQPGDTSQGLTRHHTLSAPTAPWIETGFLSDPTAKALGWMVESLEINPFNSDHFLYGTGLTIFGSKDLTKWDASPRENVNIQSMAYGIEETAVLAVASVPGGPELLAGVGDVDGFTYALDDDVDTPATQAWLSPSITTTNDVDYAGLQPLCALRVGNNTDGTRPSLLLSADGGHTWAYHPGTPNNSTYGGQAAYGADGARIVWATWNAGVFFSPASTAPFVELPELATTKSYGLQAVVVAADKRNADVFYASFTAPGGAFLVSTNGGASFCASGAGLGSDASLRKVVDIAVHPAEEGKLYVSTSEGLFASTDHGATFAALGCNIMDPQQLSLGLAAAGADAWTLYVFGNGPAGWKLYASDDDGASWRDVQGNKQGFGKLVTEKTRVAGSANVPGRVYVGTNGRGTFYGEP